MMRLALLVTALPAALGGQAATCSDHLMLQVQHRKAQARSSARKSEPAFEPVDGGEGRVCRGADAMDRGAVGSEYLVYTGSSSLDECKQHCLDTSECQGIEFRIGRCEVWTRPEGITSASGSGFTCLRLRRGPSPFSPADGGSNRACRGRDSSDRGVSGTDYVLTGAASLDECKGRCLTTPACRGIEFKPGRCEVWTRAAGIGATAWASGYECHRFRGHGPVVGTTVTTTRMDGKPFFEPVDGGEDRACRGSGPRDAGKVGRDYRIVSSATSLDECKAHCATLGAATCAGVEYSAGRCEVWTRMGGIGASARAEGFHCARYRPAQGTGSCGGFDPAEEGRDLVGTQIAAVYGQSPAQCCHVCEAANGCEGFAYVAAVEECYLKANITGTRPKAGVVAQVKHVPTSKMPTCEGYGAPQVDRDVAGVELEQAHAISSEYCCAACARAEGCQGFTYYPALQMCYLKTNVTGTYARPGRVSHLVPMQTTPPPTARPGSCNGYGTLLRNTEVSGSPLAHVVVHTVDECCGACDRAAGCDGYAYLERFKMCYLKTQVTGTYPKEGPLARIRRGLPVPVVQPSCGSYRDAMEDTDAIGSLLGEVPATSSTQCCSACEEITACEGFTFHDQACYLKGAVTGTYPHPGRVSRIKSSLNGTAPSPSQASCVGFTVPRMGMDLVGTLLKKVPAPSAGTCCFACAGVPGCEGFSYVEAHKACYLKGGVTGMVHKSGCITRLRPAV